MPLDLSINQLEELWDAHHAQRAKRKKRQDYFRGKQDVLDREGETYVDGTKKTARVANWIGYGIKQFVGTLTESGFQVSNKDAGEDVPEGEGADIYAEIADANDFRALDVEDLRAALVNGVSVEVHEFVDGEIRIDNSNPLHWVLLYDTNDELVGALYRVKLEAGTVHEGEYLKEPVELMTFYDDAEIVDYRRDGEGEFAEVNSKEHFYGTPPIVDFHINETRTSYISDDMIGQQDEYNDIDSISGDDLRRTVDALLRITGHDPDWIKANWAEIMENRYLPAEDAQFVTRQADIAPVIERLKRTREHIHMALQVPDVTQIVGATGVTSGIALRLKFLPMHREASSIINYLKRSVWRRIRLINAMLKMQEKTQIEDVVVTINFSLPSNRKDHIDSVTALGELVSHRTKLEQLEFIDDVERELLRLQNERLEAQESGSTPQELAARQDAAIDTQALNLQPVVQDVITESAELLKDAIVDQMLRDGAIDRLLSRASNNGGGGES